MNDRVGAISGEREDVSSADLLPLAEPPMADQQYRPSHGSDDIQSKNNADLPYEHGSGPTEEVGVLEQEGLTLEQ